MPGTARGLRTDPATRLAELADERPEWRTWISLLRETAQALEEEDWQVGLSGVETAPLLEGCSLQVDRGQVHRFMQRLLRISDGGRGQPDHPISEANGLNLIQAAIQQDLTALSVLAWELCVDDQALTSVAHLAAFPVLQACGRLVRDRIPNHWPKGYCPVCAAWPILAERRGLDRGRYLRCGRCGVGWEVEWLRCMYCGERDHERLGSLVPEHTGELLKVETCTNCHGYLKSVATLQGIPCFELLVQDLETVELDLVALERGYSRPEMRRLDLKVTGRES